MSNVSTGRGGAGNVSRDRTKNTTGSPALAPVQPATGKQSSESETTTTHLVTPHIREKQYTTGRGGSGNIVPNDNPEVARKAQDVDTPPVRREYKPGEAYHHGRGGEGNLIVTQGDKSSDASKGKGNREKGNVQENTEASGAFREGARKIERRGSNLAEKGREVLGRLRSGDRQRRGSGSKGTNDVAISEVIN